MVPLPVAGDYTEYQNKTKPFQIDLGTNFISIQEMRFYCAGSIKGGLSTFVGPLNCPFDSYFSARFRLDQNSLLVAKGPYAGRNTYPAYEPFESEISFISYGNPCSSFLLDGKAEGWVQLGGDGYGEIIILDWPTGYVDAAWITIVATPVPEPATIALFACIFFHKRKDKGTN